MNIQCIVLSNKVLISTVEEVASELGEPDCKLINPYEIKSCNPIELVPWLDCTFDTEFMIHSTNILTIAKPTDKLIESYKQIIK